MTARRPWRRIAVIALVAIIVALSAAYLYVGSVVYDELSVTFPACHGRFVDNTPAAFAAEGVDTTPYLMSTYETIALPSRERGVSISGWYVPGERGTAGPAVVLVHGHDSCKREGRVLLAAGMLHRNGISTLLIDLRNHGDSTVTNGRYAGGTREYLDVLGAWDWLATAKGFAPGHVGLLGMSLGAATVLIATGEEPRVPATWEDSSYADLDMAVQAELERNHRPTFLRFGGYLMARIRSGDDLTGRSPLAAVGKLAGRPIFITHGTADERLSVRYAADLAEAVRAHGGTVDPWIVDGARHVEAILLHPADYERRLVAFFDAALGDR